MTPVLHRLRLAAKVLPRGFIPFSAVLSVFLSILPGGWWFTMGGGMRWQWGCPIPAVVVQGRSPFHGDWGFGSFNYGPGYLGLLANLIFWISLILGGLFVAAKLSKITGAPVRSGFTFAAVAGVVVILYVTFYERVWTRFLLGSLTNAS
jgi:hypothetical protein